jgi:glycosyltransferase involved in cell wall biosynthesis
LDQKLIGKKKILHTTTRIVLGGGVEKNIYYTISNLQHEYEFHLSSGVEFKDDLFQQNLPQVPIIICPHLVNKISPIKDLKALWFYYRLIRKEKYDIVHTHETKASFITKLAAWLARCPYVIYGLHGVTFNDPMSNLKRKFYILLEKLTINCSDLIISVGQNTIDAYHKENIGKSIPYEIVRSGIDVDNYIKKAVPTSEKEAFRENNLKITKDDFVMITVGRFSNSKAQRYSIQVFAELKKKYSHIKFILIGEGELLEECKTLATNLGLLSSDIIFLGYQKEVPKYLSISDLFVFTSLREGLPRVIVEASILELPVVTFEVEGATEILENEKTGFIIPQKNTELLFYKIEQLILQPERRKQFGVLAKKHVEIRWDIKQMGNQLDKIYKQNIA